MKKTYELLRSFVKRKAGSWLAHSFMLFAVAFLSFGNFGAFASESPIILEAKTFILSKLLFLNKISLLPTRKKLSEYTIDVTLVSFSLF